MNDLSQIRGVQFITHKTALYSYTESARMALEGGCRWIQLRMKNAPTIDIERTTLEIKQMCQTYNAVLIIDDHVDIAKDLHTHGVHLGKNDMSVRKARMMLGSDAIIGGTANTFYDVERLYMEGADYIGCGPYRYTTTKKDLAPILEIEGYRHIISRMRDKGIRCPIVAIGGITRKDIPPLLSIGVDGIALSGSMLYADNPIEEMRNLIQTFKSNE